MTTIAPVPAPDKVRLTRKFDLSREGIDRTLFFFSYSGAMIVEGHLPVLGADLEGHRLDVSPPLRIAAPSFRPTPQLTFENMHLFFDAPVPTPFPLQVAAFPGTNSAEGVTANCWFGPSTEVLEGAPPLPKDTLVATLWGPESPNQKDLIEEFCLQPLLEWLRVLTHQWWIGRSVEGALGSLHFVMPLDEHGKNVGSPTPFVGFTGPGPAMRPISRDVWIEAAEQAFKGKRAAAEDSLRMDASYALASREFRSGVILGACAVEAARDAVLARRGLKLSNLKTSTTDLLKHLSIGFGTALGRNLQKERPDLFDAATALWSARGAAAHGKAVKWRVAAVETPIERVEFSVLSNALEGLLDWVVAL